MPSGSLQLSHSLASEKSKDRNPRCAIQAKMGWQLSKDMCRKLFSAYVELGTTAGAGGPEDQQDAKWYPRDA